jgi:hypothetical protein
MGAKWVKAHWRARREDDHPMLAKLLKPGDLGIPGPALAIPELQKQTIRPIVTYDHLRENHLSL